MLPWVTEYCVPSRPPSWHYLSLKALQMIPCGCVCDHPRVQIFQSSCFRQSIPNNNWSKEIEDKSVIRSTPINLCNQSGPVIMSPWCSPHSMSSIVILDLAMVTKRSQRSLKISIAERCYAQFSSSGVPRRLFTEHHLFQLVLLSGPRDNCFVGKVLWVQFSILGRERSQLFISSGEATDPHVRVSSTWVIL